jgi:hypothetical protein
VLNYPHLIPATGVTTDAAIAQTLDAIDRRDELGSSLHVGRILAEGILQGYVEELRLLLVGGH